MVRISLRLLLVNLHSTLVARIGPFAACLLVLHNVYSCHFLVAVDAGHEDVGAGRLMQFNFLAQTLGLALVEGLTLDWLEIAHVVVRLHFHVAQGHWTA